MRYYFAAITFLGLFFAPIASAQSLPIGDLALDGPATPEQLALLVPVTGSLPNTATAEVRYRRSSSSAWTEAHPLFRVRPNFSTTPAVGRVTDDFAWTIIGLTPGRTYDVEVSISSGGSSEVRNATFTTRSLPPAAGTPNKIIATGASNSEIQATLDNLQPGDVVQFEIGQYAVSGLALRRSGTKNSPIYIRGESRSNVILNSSARTIIHVFEADNVIIENLTIRGTGSDGPIGSLQRAITSFGISTSAGPARLTVRNLTITGIDSAITIWDEASQALVYDNTIVGNNRWNSAFLGDNRTWDDDGINLPGYGNAAFNNTISGFGDTFSYAQHSGNETITESRSVHFYRNEIRNSLDDVVEVDHAQRNVTFYDNRAHNVSTCTSLDPLYGGPFIYARNICVNPARVNLHKWNDTNTGQFIYNNTFIIGTTTTGGDPDISSWYQPNNGTQEAYGFRNNVIVYRGGGNMLWLESGGHNVVDWTHNSWYPNREMQWDFELFSDLSDARNNLRATTPIFSGTSRRMENDNNTVSNPWTTTITLGPNSLTEITASFTPILSQGTSPKNSAAVIANITDNFAGAAPDRGALIDGRNIPDWGDQNSAPLPPPVTPNPPANLDAN